MVLSNQINIDKKSIINKLEEYNKVIQDLSSSWYGESYNILLIQVNNYVDEYKDIIEKQMSSFSNACTLYEDYEEKKKLFYEKKNKYIELLNNKQEDSSMKKTYSVEANNLSSDIKQLQDNLIELKNKINIILSNIGE